MELPTKRAFIRSISKEQTNANDESDRPPQPAKDSEYRVRREGSPTEVSILKDRKEPEKRNHKNPKSIETHGHYLRLLRPIYKAGLALIAIAATDRLQFRSNPAPDSDVGEFSPIHVPDRGDEATRKLIRVRVQHSPDGVKLSRPFRAGLALGTHYPERCPGLSCVGLSGR